MQFIHFKVRNICVFLTLLSIIFLLIVNLPLSNPVSASATAGSIEDDTRAPPSRTRQGGGVDQTEALEWVETTLEFTLKEPIRFSVLAEFKIHEIYLPEYGQDGHMSADEIRMIYRLETNKTPVNPKIELAIENKINTLFVKILNRTFKESFRIFDTPHLDLTSLYYPTDEHLYDPPVIATHFCSFLEQSEESYFSKTELDNYTIQSLSDLFEGALKLGATVTQDIQLYANAGHKNTYIFKVNQYETTPGGTSADRLWIEHGENEIKKDRTLAQFTIDNINGIGYKVKDILGLALRAEYPNEQTREKVEIDFNFNFKDLDAVSIEHSTVAVRSLLLKDILNKLPSNINDISVLSADGLRLFLNNTLINLSDIAKDLDAELTKIGSEFSRIFNTTSNPEFIINWSLDSVAGLEKLYYLDDSGAMERLGTDRPVYGYLSTQEIIRANLFGNSTPELIKGLLNAGATAEWDISIRSKYDCLYNLTLPENITILEKKPAPDSDKNRNTYKLDPTKFEKVTLAAKFPAMYDSSQADIEVRIDLHEIDILSFSEYYGSIDIDAKGNLHHIKMDPDTRFARALPKRVAMDYYNSDVLRLIYSEELLDFEEVQEDMYSAIKENITKMLEKDLKMRVDFEEKNLEFDGDTAHMDGAEPINFEIKANGKMHITEDKLVRMGAFITKQIQLPITGVKAWNVTYILILPPHIEVLGRPWVDDEDTTTRYTAPDLKKNSDGRYVLTVTILGDPEEDQDIDELELEVDVNLDIDLTIWFFLSKVMIPIVLFIVLLVLIIVIYLMRRRKTKLLKKLESAYDQTMLEEDYGPTFTLGDIRDDDKQKQSFDKPDSEIKEDIKLGRGRTVAAEPADQDYQARLRELVPRVGEGQRGRGRGMYRGRDRRRIGKGKRQK